MLPPVGEPPRDEPPRPRVVRERLLEPRLDLLRELLARGDFFAPAPLVERELVRDDFFAALARDPDERLFAAPVDLARELVDFLRALLDREVFARPLLDLRLSVDLRAVPRPERDVPDELVLPVEPSSLHLPDITRCAASATASAMIEPNLVALAMTLVAAADAVSAASSPASRILRRAAGLALIAAAAAASPAASISLLIAAFASLSAVLLLDPEEREDDFELDDLEEVFLVDFAIA